MCNMGCGVLSVRLDREGFVAVIGGGQDLARYPSRHTCVCEPFLRAAWQLYTK